MNSEETFSKKTDKQFLSAIIDCVQNHNYSNGMFLAERYFQMCGSEDSR